MARFNVGALRDSLRMKSAVQITGIIIIIIIEGILQKNI